MKINRVLRRLFLCDLKPKYKFCENKKILAIITVTNSMMPME